MTGYLAPLGGGALLGLSAVLFLVLTGRIAGISGLFGRIVDGHPVGVNMAFLLGLLTGPWTFALIYGKLPQISIAAPLPSILIAGLLVGFGTRMGSGCTSGHGILGLARLSRRSFAATATFLITGIVVATASGALS
ncbi:MAG: YeeE/YedE family protein [Paracoccaceae bacterium]